MQVPEKHFGAQTWRYKFYRQKGGQGLALFEMFPLNNLALRFLPLQFVADLQGECSHRAVTPVQWNLM